jgi:hypothetical protein
MLASRSDTSSATCNNVIGRWVGRGWVKRAVRGRRCNALLAGHVGLVEKRARTERGQDGLYRYYSATVFGEVTLTRASTS